MFERLQKPFLTVETGEAYQPIRIAYTLNQKENLFALFDSLKCFEKTVHGNAWNLFWRDETDDMHFESIDSFQRNPNHHVRLGTMTVREEGLFLNLPSFKRACILIPFFHKLITHDIAHVERADFINKVFGLDERLPHGFAELFKEEELDKIVRQRVSDYEQVQEKCEHAGTPEEAFKILNEYTKVESHKRLPYAERYAFVINEGQDSDVVFLGFYIFLRGRELVAIRRWFGDTGYTLANAAEETVEKVFGGMDIDIIE